MIIVPIIEGPVSRRSIASSAYRRHSQKAMASTPAYLFRVWSHSSNGTNTCTRFAPASTKKPEGNTSSKPPDLNRVTANELLNAFIGRDTHPNRFVYFTQSLLYALQFAAHEKSRDDWTNISITCIDPSTCKDAEGNAVVFHHAPNLIQQYSVAVGTNRDGEKRTYSDEYLAIDCVVNLGAGCRTASFDDVVQRGLYTMSPELGVEAKNSRGAQLHQAVRRLREYSFNQGKTFACRDADVHLAAELSLAFAPISDTPGSETGMMDLRILACFLGLRGRHIDDLQLTTLVGGRDVANASNLSGTTEITTAPEIKLAECLWKGLKNGAVSMATHQMVRPTDSALVRWEAHEYLSWCSSQRRGERGARPERSDRTRKVRKSRSGKAGRRGRNPWPARGPSTRSRLPKDEVQRPGVKSTASRRRRDAAKGSSRNSIELQAGGTTNQK